MHTWGMCWRLLIIHSLTHAPSWTSGVIIVQIDSAQEDDQALVICCWLLACVSCCWGESEVEGEMIVGKEAQEDGESGVKSEG